MGVNKDLKFHPPVHPSHRGGDTNTNAINKLPMCACGIPDPIGRSPAEDEIGVSARSGKLAGTVKLKRHFLLSKIATPKSEKNLLLLPYLPGPLYS